MRPLPWPIMALLTVAPCLAGLSPARVHGDEPAKVDVAAPLVDVHLQAVEIFSDLIHELPDLCAAEDRNAAYWLVYEVLGRPPCGEKDDYAPRQDIVEAKYAKTLECLLQVACRHNLAKMLADPTLTAAAGNSVFFNSGRAKPTLQNSGAMELHQSRIERNETLKAELEPTIIQPTLEYRRIGVSLDLSVSSVEHYQVQLDLSTRCDWLRHGVVINQQRSPGLGSTSEGKWTGELQFGAGVLLSGWRRNIPSTSDLTWPQHGHGSDLLLAEPIETLVFARVEKRDIRADSVNTSAGSATTDGPSQRLLSIQAIEFSPARLELWQPQGLNDEEMKAWQLLKAYLLPATNHERDLSADQPVIPLKRTPIQELLAVAVQAKVIVVLAEPNLIVVDGREGYFNSGGEFITPPEYRGAIKDEASATSFKYGTQIRLLTQPTGDGATHCQIHFTLSEVSQQFSQRIGKVTFPGFKIREVSSMASLRPDQTWMIRGWHDVHFNEKVRRSTAQKHMQVVRAKSNVETVLFIQSEPVDGADAPPVAIPPGDPTK